MTFTATLLKKADQHHAFIVKVNPNATFSFIYCATAIPQDLLLLRRYYRGSTEINKLFSLGDILSLEETPDDCTPIGENPGGRLCKHKETLIKATTVDFVSFIFVYLGGNWCLAQPDAFVSILEEAQAKVSPYAAILFKQRHLM